MSDYERCFLCDEPTGRAGRADDSLYDEDGLGPYCEGCWDAAIDAALKNAETTDFYRRHFDD